MRPAEACNIAYSDTEVPQEGKTRKNIPIIVTFASFKEKNAVLLSGPKLKGSGLALSEDFPASVRLAHRKLLGHAKTLGKRYSLRVDKLVVDNDWFIYNPVTQSVDRVGS